MALSAVEITAIGVGLGNITALIKVLAVINKSGKNGNGGRGPCGLHINLVERIGKIEGATERVRADLSTAHIEDRENFDKIFEKLEDVKVNVALAGEKATAAQKTVADVANALERRKFPGTIGR
jgi:hypothetical protein